MDSNKTTKQQQKMPAEPIPIVTQDNQQQSFPTLSSSHPIFGRWSAFSPRSPPAGTGIGAGSPPSNTSGSSFHDDDDLGDLRNHTWHAAAQRRAASLSMSAGSNFLGSQLGSGSVGSPPTGGPLSDKVALGQGVLRRLSFSSGFGAGSGSSSRVSNQPPGTNQRYPSFMCVMRPEPHASLTYGECTSGTQTVSDTEPGRDRHWK